MTILKPPWLGPVLSENFTFFQLFQIANPNLRHAGFTPVADNPAGRMLEVIIIEKIPFRLLMITLIARVEVFRTLVLLQENNT